MYFLVYEDRLEYLPIMGFSPLILKYGIICSDHSSPLYFRVVFLRVDIKAGRREVALRNCTGSLCISLLNCTTVQEERAHT